MQTGGASVAELGEGGVTTLGMEPLASSRSLGAVS